MYEFDIGEPDDSGTPMRHTFHFKLSLGFTVFMTLIIALFYQRQVISGAKEKATLEMPILI